MKPEFKLIFILVILFLVSLSFRLWYSDINADLQGDEPEYNSLATQILNGNGLVKESGEPTAWRTPGLPIVIAAIYKICGTQPAAAKLFLIFLSALTSIILYFLTLLLFKNNFTALISGIIWAILPDSINWAGLFYGETLTAFLLILSFLLAVKFSEKSNKQGLFGIIAAGFLVGFAVLTRGYTIFIIAALPAYLLTFRKSKRLALICLFSSMLIPSIWVLRNILVLHSPTLSTETYETVWLGNNRWTRGAWPGEWTLNPNSEQKAYFSDKYPGFFDKLSETERSKIFRKEAISEIINNPVRILWLVPRKIAIYLSPNSYLGFDWVYLIILPFAFTGFYLILANKLQRDYLWLLAFPICAVALICLLTFGDSRFRQPVDFCFVILASFGLTRISEKAKIFPVNQD